jgi:transcriptional regulator GlxA family with amidase domain
MLPRNTAILLFNDAEVLDFAGPFEVFNAANRMAGEVIFSVYTIAENKDVISARNGLKVIPDYSLNNCPSPDILIIPGGSGRKIQMTNQFLLNWIKSKYNGFEFLLSVCTGSLIVGKTGLLDGLEATTHHNSYQEFENTFPSIKLIKNAKYIDNGKIITAAGVSSGINMSLYVIGRLFGEELKAKTASHIEFNP